MSVDVEPRLESLDLASIDRMLEAAGEIRECYRLLDKAGLNIVGEVLRGQGTFYELEHYPQGDVFDKESQCQYYYHAHREDVDEHGHFHTFVRAGAMPEGMKSAQGFVRSEEWPEGNDAVAHLIAISMDPWGFPIGLFTTNRWVTDETWYHAEDVTRLLDGFEIDHAWPSLPVNRWLTAMIRLYRHQIQALLEERDRVIHAAHLRHPEKDVLEDRDIEVLSQLDIDVDSWEQRLQEERQRRVAATTEPA